MEGKKLTGMKHGNCNSERENEIIGSEACTSQVSEWLK